MITATEKFLDTLRASHQKTVRAGLWLPDANGAYQFQGYLGIVDGTLTIDGTRNILRQASMRVSSLDSLLVGASSASAARDFVESITSESAELTLEWGLKYPNGQYEWVQIARLRVEETRLESGSVVLDIASAYDAGARVADFDLPTVYAPYNTYLTKLTYLEAIQDLVNAAYPSAQPPTWVIDPAVNTTALPPDGTTYTGSRWNAIQSLAAAINVSVWPDTLGRWVVKPAVTSRTPVWEVNSGVDGVMVKESTQFSRREQYNAVAVRWGGGKTTSGLVFLVDADPDSPTYFDGPFGKKPRPEETNTAITTEAAAIAYAATLLEKNSGRTRGIELQAVHMPLLEPNDVVAVWLPDGTAERHIIDAISLPLGPGGVMTMQTRIMRTGAITYEQDGVIYNDTRYTYEGQAQA